MNDTELDELLDRWTVPEASPGFRHRARAGFVASRSRAPRSRKLLLAAFAAVAAGIWLMGAPAVRAPYLVDSQCIRYDDDLKAESELLITSYSREGRETVVSSSIPGRPLENLMRLGFNSIGSVWQRLTLPFIATSDQLKRIRAKANVSTGFGHYYVGEAADLVRAGCAVGKVTGHETLLNYSTVVVELPMGSRWKLTASMAPELGCFPLKATFVETRPDGTVRASVTKRALRVTMNP